MRFARTFFRLFLAAAGVVQRDTVFYETLPLIEESLFAFLFLLSEGITENGDPV